jgi:hypothetical protein
LARPILFDPINSLECHFNLRIPWVSRSVYRTSVGSFLPRFRIPSSFHSVEFGLNPLLTGIDFPIGSSSVFAVGAATPYSGGIHVSAAFQPAIHRFTSGFSCGGQTHTFSPLDARVGYSVLLRAGCLQLPYRIGTEPLLQLVFLSPFCIST